MLTGTLVTLVASIVPALRATRVPPISAVREGSSATPSGGSGRKPYAGLITTGIALALLGIGLFGGVAGGLVALTLVVGVLMLFVGIAMLAPRLVKPIASLVGLPAARSAARPAGSPARTRSATPGARPRRPPR